MGSVVALCTQQLETQGYTVVKDVLSAKQIALLARGRERMPEFHVVRRVFEGLPMRIVEGLAGTMVLSMARYGTPEKWHRGRTDTVESGAPADFVPSFDVAMVFDHEPCMIEAIRGSARLGPRDPVPAMANAALEFGPEDVVILDSRTLRRWPTARCDQTFWFSVIRPWMIPLMDFYDQLPKDTPPRALQFAGRRPSRDIGEWLFATHSKRSS